MSNLREITIYALINDKGHCLTYNPVEGFIFFGNGANGLMLSEELCIPTSHRAVPSPPAIFSLEEMRKHYGDRLKEGYRALGNGQKHLIGDPRRRSHSSLPPDFEYGLTDT